MSIKEHLSTLPDSFLKECHDELKEYGKHGILSDGKVRELNKTYYQNDVSTLSVVHFLILEEIANRYFN